MKTNFINRQLLMLLVVLSSNVYQISAVECCVGNSYQQQRCSPVACPQITCGCFDLQFQAGIAPIVWANRGDFQIVSCNIAANDCQGFTCAPIVPIFQMPKFNDLYKMPWTVGGKIGYAVTECSELYLEANYRRANGKDCFAVNPRINIGTFIADTNFVFNTISNYTLFDIYLGVRTYVDLCWCDGFAGFIGMQVGLARHKEVTANITTSSNSNECAAPFVTSCVQLFGKHTAVAAGANFALEYCLGCGFALVLTAEIIATCGPNGNQNIPFFGCTPDIILPEAAPSNFIVGGIGTELLFPITFGMKYNF